MSGELDHAVSTIVEAVADLERHPYDLACPFGCEVDARYARDPHADDCPITLARRITADVVVERRAARPPLPRIGPVDW